MSKVLRFDSEDPNDDADNSANKNTSNEVERPSGAEESALVRVIVKVNTGGYVPAGFRVRSRVDEELFTAETTEADLTVAADDPRVESVARARRLDLT